MNRTRNCATTGKFATRVTVASRAEKIAPSAGQNNATKSASKILRYGKWPLQILMPTGWQYCTAQIVTFGPVSRLLPLWIQLLYLSWTPSVNKGYGYPQNSKQKLTKVGL